MDRPSARIQQTCQGSLSSDTETHRPPLEDHQKQKRVPQGLATPSEDQGNTSHDVGLRDIISQIGPAYNSIAWLITGLPKWTPRRFLLAEAGLPPLDLLLRRASQQYGIRILLSKDNHPCKKPLLQAIRNPNPKPKSTKEIGLAQIAALLLELTHEGPDLEDRAHPDGNPGHQQTKQRSGELPP